VDAILESTITEPRYVGDSELRLQKSDELRVNSVRTYDRILQVQLMRIQQRVHRDNNYKVKVFVLR